ncbi:DUF3231 family protein [Camelliibacillus cellulosilyticus]|uniref:DUF3231 family protein n=1 Tax=Camelliibacillus cellulosilyticus TaxID=2174486 RepID=A0ABV9GJ80_9BACL
METPEINHDHIPLTAAELAQIWSNYMNDSMNICLIKHFLSNVEDAATRSVLEAALEISEKHLPKLTSFFRDENWPLPHGFKENEDLDLSAPRLYSDNFYANFVYYLGILALNAYSVGVSLAARADVHAYYTECLAEAAQLHRMALETLETKGLYVRAPYITTPNTVEFVDSTDYLKGYFTDRRPLTALEISNLYANFQRNAMGFSLLTGFAQVAKNKKVTQYLDRGRQIAGKHCEVFSSLLRETEVPTPMTWDTAITASQTAPFSDKLMMFMTTALNALGIGYYGASVSTSPRRDIGVIYGRLISEIGNYSLDGAKMMIDHKWLEEPPRTVDREELIKGK